MCRKTYATRREKGISFKTYIFQRLLKNSSSSKKMTTTILCMKVFSMNFHTLKLQNRKYNVILVLDASSLYNIQVLYNEPKIFNIRQTEKRYLCATDIISECIKKIKFSYAILSFLLSLYIAQWENSGVLFQKPIF